MASSQKDIALEALRGLAAAAVLIAHLMYTFYPQTIPVLDRSGIGKGHAAVVVFFVLSGFVLTRRFFTTGDRAIIARGAIKRWPRLVGPVLLTVLVSWLLFQFNLYSFRAAGLALQSDWLATTPISETNPTFVRAFAQGTITTFLLGDATFDNALWTMRVEFIGSFLAFGLALLVKPLPKWIGGTILVVVTLAVSRLLDQHLAAFPIGVALAAFLPGIQLSRSAAVIAIAVSLYLLNYIGDNSGPYAVFNLYRLFAPYAALLNAFAAALLILAIERSIFASWLSGAKMRILGEFSFPLYLIHLPIICSAGTYLFLTTGSSWLSGTASFMLVILATIPLVWFNSSWVVIINEMTSKIMFILKPMSRRRRSDIWEYQQRR
jgi:peptidoglycan/LPS O-acetylase OafA/YrhL